uniref:Putative gag-pol polyprotein n=1 Tax=Davidia involucrata TaxID=16924 RepID=A0A5B6YVD8_DAVIN
MDPVPSRYPQRLRKCLDRFGLSNSCYSANYCSFLASIHSLSEPTSYKEAIIDPLWQQVMDEELSALHKTSMWELVPSGKRAVGCKWVYKIKTRSNSSMERYKARLVAKGFAQKYGIDYEETFAPVAKMTTVCTVIAVATVRQWGLSQMDVKNVFLNGDLVEEVFMVPPPGLPHNPDEVCKLQKALYGLKQSLRAWFAKFSAIIYDLGICASDHDSTIFLCSTSAGCIVLLLYVDDMILTDDDTAGTVLLKSQLQDHFEMKDLGPLRYFLGIEVASYPKGYLLSQSKYASDVIQRARLTDTRTVETPLELNVRYSSSDGVLLAEPTYIELLLGV